MAHKKLTFEANLIDLAWHQREFQDRSTFAYIVYTPDESEYVGCFYLYPPGYRNESSKGCDVDASWWFTKRMKEKGYYEKLYAFLRKWLKEEWGFSSVGFTNKIIPQ